MKKKISLFLLTLLTSTAISLAAVASEYCATPTGHLNQAEFGDPNGRVLLTISKIDNTSMEVIVQKSPDSSVEIDFLQVNPAGYPAVIVGTDEGELLSQYRAVLTFETAPQNVTLEILWSNQNWGGRWMIQNLTVPFDASCSNITPDTTKPIITAASASNIGATSVDLTLTATDTDDEAGVTIVKDFVINDATNELSNLRVSTNSSGLAKLKGLKANTMYNLSIQAVDGTGNVSDNYQVVTFTTLDASLDQELVDDFESGDKGWADVVAWHGITANPASSDLNSSAHVMQINRGAETAAFWAGAILNPAPQTTGKYLHVKMYRNNTHNPKVKLSDAQPTEILPIAGTIIAANKWQDIVFDISAITQRQFVFIMVDETASAIGTETSVYVDDIMVNNDATPRTGSLIDSSKPIMGTATVEAITFGSATLVLSATDIDENNESAVVSAFLITDTQNGINNRLIQTDTQGKFILSGLTPATAYALTIKAKDISGNISDNEILLEFTTSSVPESLMIDNFEGANKGWIAAEGAHQVFIIDNPHPNGINPTAKVMQTGRDANSNFWAAPTVPNLNIEGGAYRYMHIMTYRNTKSPNGPMQLKVSDVAPVFEMEPINHNPMEIGVWQDFVFDLSVLNGKKIDFIYFMMDKGTLTENLILYMDEIVLNNEVAPRSIPDSVEDAVYNAYNINAANGTIHIENLKGEVVRLYSIEGRQVEATRDIQGSLSIPTGKGLFLVVVGEQCHKVSVQ